MTTSFFNARVFELAPDLSAADVAILLASLTTGGKAPEAYGYWRKQLDWETIPIHWQGLLPLLHQNLVRMGIEDEFTDRIKGVRRFTWARNLKFIALATLVHAELAKAAVSALSSREIALIASRYADRSVRTIDDIGLLVRADQMPDTIGALSHLGFEPGLVEPPGLLDRVQNDVTLDACRFVRSSGEEVEIRWLRHGQAEHGEALWSRSRVVPFEGIPVGVPSATDQLLRICANGACRRETEFPWISDAALLINHADDVDWSEIVAWSFDQPGSGFMAWALDLLKTLFDLPISANTIAQLYRRSAGNALGAQLS